MDYRIRWGAGAVDGAATGVKRLEAFDVPLLGGGRFRVGEVAGKRPLVLVFWASWCAPCVAEAPHLQALFERHADRVAFLAISIDEPETVAALREVVQRLGLRYPVGRDPEGSVLRRFVAGGSIPLTLVFDDEGSLVYQHGNFEPGDEVELGRVIGGLAAP